MTDTRVGVLLLCKRQTDTITHLFECPILSLELIKIHSPNWS